MEKFSLKNRIISDIFQAYAELEDEIVYDDTKELISSDLEISQTFKVQNKGPSSVKKAIIRALFPR